MRDDERRRENQRYFDRLDQRKREDQDYFRTLDRKTRYVRDVDAQLERERLERELRARAQLTGQSPVTSYTTQNQTPVSNASQHAEDNDDTPDDNTNTSGKTLRKVVGTIVVAAGVAWLAKRKRTPQPSQLSPSPTPDHAIKRCATCGTTSPSSAHFCHICGSRI